MNLSSIPYFNNSISSISMPVFQVESIYHGLHAAEDTQISCHLYTYISIVCC